MLSCRECTYPSHQSGLNPAAVAISVARQWMYTILLVYRGGRLSFLSSRWNRGSRRIGANSADVAMNGATAECASLPRSNQVNT
jgi:hypothetical protein